jgi:hypothetical protein
MLCAIANLFKMDQATFSKHIYEYLLKNYPSFLENIKYHDNDSFDCTLTNPTGQFSIWIATYDKEITIGMDDPDNTSGTHTHLSFYGEEIDEQTKALKEYLEDIFADRLVFTHSNLDGYSWSKDIVKTLLDKKSKESIKYFTWTGEG